MIKFSDQRDALSQFLLSHVRLVLPAGHKRPSLLTRLLPQKQFLSFTKIEKSNLSEIINPSQWNYRQLLSPCFATEVKGTTGTGDATIAGFLAQLLDGGEPEKSITLATAVGACCVEAVDATGGIQPLPEVVKRVNSGWERLSPSISTDNWKYDYQYKIWKGPEDQVG